MTRLLLLTPQLPYPPHQGTAIRNWQLVQYLAQRHEVDLLTFAADPALALDQAAPLRAVCCRVAITPPPPRPVRRRVADLLRGHADMARRLSSPVFAQTLASWLADGYGVVQAEGIEMAPYLLGLREGLLRTTSTPRLIYDAHNAEALLQRRNGFADARRPRRWTAALYSFVQWRRLTRLERRLLRAVDRVIAVSEPDAAVLRALAPEVDPLVVPNGVDTDQYTPDAEGASPPLAPDAPWLVFTGKLDYRPNIEACRWLVERVMPQVWARRPHVRVALVGRDPAPAVARLAGPRVHVTGWVPDTQPYLRAATLCVVPLRVGGGTRLKILEALALGCAIVSTPQGAEGLDLGAAAVLADGVDDFARAVVDLLDDPARRAALGQAGRALAVARYDWRALLPVLDPLYA